MKILILGHKGMLGSELMLRLAIAHEVTGKDIDAFDITDPADCLRIVEECAPEAVVNATGYTNVDGCEADAERCFAVNAEGVKHLALACRGKGILVVHFSTDYVFDGKKGTPYREEDPTGPLSVYGASKLAGEQFLQAFAERYLLVRTAWLYGKNGHHFVEAILKKAKEGQGLEVVDDQIGSPTYTRDLAAALELLIAGGHTGLFHVTNRGRCSWYEFAVKILQYAGIGDVTVTPIKSDRLSRPAARPAWSVLDGGKFFAACGKTLPYWQIALQDYLERTGSRR
ncbi:MAG: dTDP-4-dehydrorhamnose reductase [Deltaproteobacteria bacterium]|nr:dTDP-4-dehydrorhamnose reductase [Deltaproteobacteria bacterium]